MKTTLNMTNIQYWADETRKTLAFAKDSSKHFDELMTSRHGSVSAVNCLATWLSAFDAIIGSYFAQITEVVDGLDGATNEEREAAYTAYLQISKAHRTVRGFVEKIPACRARFGL